MGWIKRNLFFAVGGLMALVLLGAAGWYDYRSWDHNATALGRLDEIVGKLKELRDKKPSWGSVKIDNIKMARDQEADVLAWIAGTTNYFEAITPVPDSPEVTSEAFAAALRRTLDQLQHEADDSGIQLPPRYGFSFEAQRQIVKFAPGSLPQLAVQLGEVKKISEILFAARVNALDGIQRVRVSDDDIAGPQTDYLGDVSVTNTLAIMTPYAVTFRSFSPELAAVLAGLADSPNGFIVNAVNIQPAAVVETAGGGGPSQYQPREGIPGMPQPFVAPGRGGLPTVLKEQMLRITLEVVIVKPLLKK